MSFQAPNRRVMPNDPAAEQAVLSGCLLRSSTAMDILEGVSADIFYSPAHRAIAQAMLDMLADGTPIDLVTICAKLTERGALAQAGGPVYLAELTNSPVSVANARHHVGIVRGCAQRRAMIDLGMGLCDAAYDPTANPGEFAAQAQKTIDAVLEERVNVPSQRPSQVAKEAYAYVERMQMGHGDLIKSSLYGLNALMGGYAPGENIVIAARPGVGKTAFALCEAAYALKKGHSVGIMSLEMRAAQLALRFFSQKASVNAQRFRDGQFADDDMRKILDGADWLARQDDRLRLWDRPGLTPGELRAQIRKWKREIDVKLVIVDYLQLMKADHRSHSREQEVAEISREVKNAAIEYNVAILALSQLNRKVDDRKSKRPLLSDLRESGAIEQDADIIIFIVPPEKTDDKDVQPYELDVAKGRSNRVGTAEAYYNRPFLRFYNRTYQREDERTS